ncbi:MAG: energy-coupling factor ABC transporter ATP-binding protein, partial [Spirochaetota bacterium]
QNSDAQFVGQTLREDIGFGPENLGWEKRRVEQAVEESARMLGIVHLLDRHPHFLSGGEKKKAAIAGIVAMEPEIIVMDEPFAGLDYRGVCAVAREIASLKASGRTLLVITHDIEKILAHVSRMMVMHSGNIVYDGPPVMDSRLFEDNMIRFPRGLSVEECTWL